MATTSARVDNADMMRHMVEDAALPLPGMDAGASEPTGRQLPKDDKKDKEKKPKKAPAGPKQAGQCGC